MPTALFSRITVAAALRRARDINPEIRFYKLVDEKRFSAGVIVFRPRRGADRKQIVHADKDVVCQVLDGRGRLRVGRRRIALAPGTICHIPRRTPHDFAAGRSQLVLFYLLITTQ
jgi:quercetin dioxygenase-like cupin family protein